MADRQSETTLKCECCPWSGQEAELATDYACPKCGERVWADQTVQQQTTDLLAAAKEIDRLSLVIDSAVRYADPMHEEAVTAALLRLRAALKDRAM